MKALMLMAAWASLGPLHGADELSVTRSVLSYTLDNGLKVLLYPDPQASEVTVNIVYRTGAKHENPGEYGMAHLLEHLAFQKTKHYREIPRLIAARGGRLNANTNADRTTYYETLPASVDNLEFALAIEADRMLNVDISEAAIQNEKPAVKKEWEQSRRSGFQPLLRELLQLAYPAHAYGRDTLGITEGLLESRAEDLRRFHARRYIPSLAVLSIGGAFAVGEARRLVEKYFAALPRRATQPETRTELTAQARELRVVKKPAEGPAYVGVLYRAMPGADASYVAAQALVHCLSSHPESPLQKKLVHAGHARELLGFVQQSVDEGFIAFMAQPGPKQDPLLLAEKLAALLESPHLSCQPSDLRRFQQENSAAWQELARDTRSLTMQLGEFEGLGRWTLMRDEVHWSQSLRLEDLKKVSRWLKRSNRTLGVLDDQIPGSLTGRRALP